MLKPLTMEGRFECDLDAVVKGKVWAFVAVIGENYPARLGIAIANEKGYNPIPEFWANSDDFDAMQLHADELNVAEGLDPKMAARIVCSTMGGQKLGIVKPNDFAQDFGCDQLLAGEIE